MPSILVRLAHLGELLPDTQIPSWLVSRDVPVPLLDGQELQFALEDIAGDPRPAEFAHAVASFLSLTSAARDAAAPLVFAYYRAIAESVGEEHAGAIIPDPASVWRHVRLGGVNVSRHPYADRKVYVQLAGNCDWEIEHGIQLVYREGHTLVRVSSQDGHLT